MRIQHQVLQHFYSRNYCYLVLVHTQIHLAILGLNLGSKLKTSLSYGFIGTLLLFYLQRISGVVSSEYERYSSLLLER